MTARLIALKPDDAAIVIGNLYRKACASLVDSANYYIAAGRALIDKKAELAHGEWLPWLAANAEVLGFDTDRTAQRLMALASNPTSTSDLDEAEALQISRQMWGNTGNQRTLGTGENEWYTPKEYIDAVRDVFGVIDLDPASSAAAQQTVQAKSYFTKATNGLEQEWHGRVWLNPPYSQPDIAYFVAKLLSELGRVTAAIMLTHNNTDTSWFHSAASRADAVCLTRGRIGFVNVKGDIATPTNGQTFFYYGTEPHKFGVRFRQIGLVLARMMD